MTDLIGGDFGDIGGAPEVPSSPPFALAQGAVMDSGAFQARWGAIVATHVQQRPMRPGVPLTTEMIEMQLRQCGINVIASGALSATSLKFYFFARQSSGPPSTSP